MDGPVRRPAGPVACTWCAGNVAARGAHAVVDQGMTRSDMGRIISDPLRCSPGFGLMTCGQGLPARWMGGHSGFCGRLLGWLCWCASCVAVRCGFSADYCCGESRRADVMACWGGWGLPSRARKSAPTPSPPCHPHGSLRCVEGADKEMRVAYCSRNRFPVFCPGLPFSA